MELEILQTIVEKDLTLRIEGYEDLFRQYLPFDDENFEQYELVEEATTLIHLRNQLKRLTLLNQKSQERLLENIRNYCNRLDQ